MGIEYKLLLLAERDARWDFSGIHIAAYDLLKMWVLHEMGHCANHYESTYPEDSIALEGLPEGMSLEIMEEENPELVLALKTDYMKISRRGGYSLDAQSVFNGQSERARELLSSRRIFLNSIGFQLGYDVTAGSLKALEFRSAGISWNAMLRQPFQNNETVLEYLARVRPRIHGSGISIDS